jgi:hypothetical protein
MVSVLRQPTGGCLTGQQPVHHVDDVLHGTHGLEGLRLQVAAQQGLELHDQVDRVDAVDVQVVVQTGLGRDARRFDLKAVLEDLDDAIEKFVLGHGKS